jgi:transcriptional regulator with XRE-family HTH domain
MRREKGLSQQELADLAGVGQDSISAIETGKHEPHPRTLRKLAKALNIEVADFFREPALAGKAEAPPVGAIPNSLDELLEVRGARTRHLADENLKKTYDQLPLEDVLQMAREVSAEIEAIGPDLAHLGKQTFSPEAMRLYTEASRRILIARFSLSARRGEKIVSVELETEFDQTMQEFEKAELALAGVG